jgi:hypothetical protein
MLEHDLPIAVEITGTVHYLVEMYGTLVFHPNEGGEKWAEVFLFIYPPPQNLNVYDLLILKFRHSAALNIVIIRNRAIGRKMRMKVIVLYPVHHFVVTNGFNIAAFKYSSRVQAHLFLFFRIRFVVNLRQDVHT